MQAFALVQEAEDVAELERRVDGHVIGQQMLRGLAAIEVAIIGLFLEEIQGGPVAVRQAALQPHRGGREGVHATAGQGRQELGDVDHLRSAAARDRRQEGHALGVQGAGAPIIDERRPAVLERQLELDQETADARDGPEDGGDFLRVLGQGKHGLDVAEDQSRSATPEQLAQKFLLRLGDFRVSQPVVDVPAMDEDRIALVLVRLRLRQLDVQGGTGGLADFHQIIHPGKDHHVIAAGDDLGRPHEPVDDRDRQASLLHDRPHALLRGLLEGPAGHRRRLGDDREDVLRGLKIDRPDLQIPPRPGLGDPDGLGREHADHAEAQGGDEREAKRRPEGHAVLTSVKLRSSNKII